MTREKGYYKPCRTCVNDACVFIGAEDTHYVCRDYKALEQEPCEDAISRSDAIRVASGYCHWSNIPKELAKLPSVNPIQCEDAISRQAVLNIDFNRIIHTTTLPSENIKRAINDLPPVSVVEKTPMLEKSNFDEKQYRFDLICAYECGRNSVAEKTGHWIEERTYMECPNCHDVWHYEENQTERFKFCPTCGKRFK